MTRRGLGRILQFVGLLILPIGMAGQLEGKYGEGGLLLIMAVGAAVFYVGYLVQHRV